MVILRYIVLFAIAALGVAMIVDGLTNTSYRLQGWTGIAVFALALAVAILLFSAVRTGRLPLRTWYLLPPIVGVGAAAMAHFNIVPAFIDLGAVLIGLGTTFVGFSGLQLWADRRGGRDWQGIVFLIVFIVAGSLLGQIAWLWP